MGLDMLKNGVLDILNLEVSYLSMPVVDFDWQLACETWLVCDVLIGQTG
jgi:hypothetical protein